MRFSRLSLQSIIRHLQVTPNPHDQSINLTLIVPDLEIGFNFDRGAGDAPFQDRKDLDDYNADERAASFVRESRQWAAYYGGKEVMLTMGDDFCYSDAEMNFGNMDRLIKYFKEHPELKLDVFYSTPSKYFKERLARKTKPLTVKYDDFFPVCFRSSSSTFWAPHSSHLSMELVAATSTGLGTLPLAPR